MTRVSAKRSKQRSKDDEKDVARIIGGRRHWADTGAEEDVEHDWMAVQVRGGLRVANETIRDGLAKATVAAIGTDKLPALVLVDRAKGRIKRYILFDLDTFADWHGLEPEEDA